MNKHAILLKYASFLLLLSTVISCWHETETNQALWYNQPATGWNDALPIGNGHLGAMVSGQIDNEILQLNDNTLYSGEPETALKELDIRPTYDQVVSMLRKEEYTEATDFLLKNWLGKLHQNYQPLGEWHIRNNSKGNISEYKRELDLEEAVVRISYKQDGKTFLREIFASHPDDIIVMRLSCDQKDGLDITTSLSSPHPTATQKIIAGDMIAMSGQAPGYVERRTLEQIEKWGFQKYHPEIFNPDGSRKYDKQVLYGDEINEMGTFFETRLKVASPEAKIERDGSSLRISGTGEIILILSSATSFNGFDKSPSREGLDAGKKAEEALYNTASFSYPSLLSRHISDYQELYKRVHFVMPSDPEQKKLPTDERINRFGRKPDPEFLTILFQYGRYLMISGSRPGGQPLNLQGIWNDKIIPPWNGGYTMNINTEMNYWPAELTNLSECHEPLFRMIREIAVSGTETARNMYGRNGWVGHHNVSIWRETYPNDGYPQASYWPMLSAWLCSHLWEHYLFNGDEAFLRDEAYPLMKSASEFFTEWLVDNGEGYLVTPVSTSPENTFTTPDGKPATVSMGCTMDIALIRELFARTTEAAEKLNTDEDFRRLLQAKSAILLPYRIGSKGQLQEWQYDFDEPEPQHRHLSHLYGMYPGNQISWDQTPELFDAVTRTLEIRGDEASSWSIGWKMNLWARLLDGDHAYRIIKNFMHPVGFGENPKTNGGLYRNMLSASPFQIDGNFGYTAGIAEMLLQSHAGYIQLLPALPSDWKEGKITGLKARGGFSIDMEWSEGKLRKATVTSLLGGNCRLRTSEEVRVSNKQAKEVNGKNPNPLFSYVDPGKPEQTNTTPAEPESGNKEAGEHVINHTSDNKYHTIDFPTEKGKKYTIIPLAK